MRCAVNDRECVPGRLRRGLCEKHYRRMKTTGGTAPPVRAATLTRFQAKEDPDGCWVYAGPLYRNGYGKLSRPVHGTRLAHRASYIDARGPIPDGLELDHLCRVRACIRPSHLEPVTRAINLRRGRAALDFCAHGHDLRAPDAIKPGTVASCVECWRRRYRDAGAKYRKRQRASRGPQASDR